jgi:hypothetical protein
VASSLEMYPKCFYALLISCIGVSVVHVMASSSFMTKPPWMKNTIMKLTIVTSCVLVYGFAAFPGTLFSVFLSQNLVGSIQYWN